MVTIKILNKNLALSIVNSLVKIDSETMKFYDTLFSSEPWDAKKFLLDLHEKWELSCVAFVNDIPVGYCICSNFLQDSAYIYRITLLKAYQKQGIGKKLLQFLFNQCKEKNIKKLYLEVNINNKSALGFYMDSGFNKVNGEILADYLMIRNKYEKTKIFNNSFIESGYPERKNVLIKYLLS